MPYTWPGKKPGKQNLLLDAYEQKVLANPDYYLVSIFRGTGKFGKSGPCATLELARAAAYELIGTGNRGVSIYAVKGNREVHVELVEPVRKGTVHGPLDSRTNTKARNK